MSDKFNLKYVTKFNNYIKKLDENKIKIEKDIENLKQVIEEKLKNYDKLLLKKNNLQQKYEEFLNFFLNKGIYFEINNSIYGLKQWDSIKIIIEKNKIILIDKKEQQVKVIDDFYVTILKDILDKQYHENLIVIRSNDRVALIHLRFNKT